MGNPGNILGQDCQNTLINNNKNNNTNEIPAFYTNRPTVTDDVTVQTLVTLKKAVNETSLVGVIVKLEHASFSSTRSEAISMCSLG